MNNKMTTNIYLSTIESNKLTKQIRRKKTESYIMERVWLVATWEGGVRERVKR